MSNFGGKNSSFEKLIIKKLKFLNIKLTKAENRLNKILTEAILNPKLTTKYWKSVKREINLIYAKMINDFSEWSKIEIPNQYKRSIFYIQKRIQKLKYVKRQFNSKTARNLIGTNYSRQLMMGLYQEANDAFIGVAIAGKKDLLTFLHRTQQTLITESLIDTTVAKGFEQGNLRKAIKELSIQLKSKMDGQKYLRAGKKSFKPRYYAELVARTKFHDAHSYAALLQAKNYNTDLVQVSSHNTTTPICMPFEGKIYSMTGQDKRFPPLQDSPPYHVNCLHLLMPTFVSGMEVQGTLKQFSDFSLGKITRPPVPSGFIPLAQRTAI